MTITSNGLTEQLLEFDPAVLSDAAYRVLLRYDLGDKWLQIQLALWHAMTEHVRNWESANKIPDPKPRIHQELYHSLS